jgi:hypothetical protein
MSLLITKGLRPDDRPNLLPVQVKEDKFWIFRKEDALRRKPSDTRIAPCFTRVIVPWREAAAIGSQPWGLFAKHVPRFFAAGAPSIPAMTRQPVPWVDDRANRPFVSLGL